MAVKVPPLLHKMSANAQKAWYKKHGMEMPAKEKSAATAGKMKAPEPKKAEPAASSKPKTAREISMERQKAYYAKGGRQPIGAGGSGGHSAMAGVGQSSAKEIIKGIRAGINPKSRGIGEEASPMIKPPTNRFDKKSDAFAHVEKHGGKVYKQTYTDSKGQQTVSYSVKKEEVQFEEVKMKDKIDPKDLPFTPDKTRIRRGPGGDMSQAKWLAKQAMMKKMKEMQKEEVVVEVADEPKNADKGEYDYEGDMAKSQLKSIITNAQRLHDMLEDNTNLPEWVQSKITLAEDYVLTAASYMEGKMNEEVQQVQEKMNLVKAKMGDVIKDFKKSDAPQFKGKSMEKRREMAIAAKLGAEREAGMREEAEGTVAVTPKEKALAAHHGDPKKITYGDVIKARLKSVAAKKMGK